MIFDFFKVSHKEVEIKIPPKSASAAVYDSIKNFFYSSTTWWILAILLLVLLAGWLIKWKRQKPELQELHFRRRRMRNSPVRRRSERQRSRKRAAVLNRETPPNEPAANKRKAGLATLTGKYYLH